MVKLGQRQLKVVIVGAVAVLAVLSMLSDTNPLELHFFEQLRPNLALASLIAVLILYGILFLMGKYLRWPKTKRVVTGIFLALLGAIAGLLATTQLSVTGFAARTRNPDYAAVALACMSAAFAFWQVVALFRRRELSKKFSICLLLFLDFYLYFASW